MTERVDKMLNSLGWTKAQDFLKEEEGKTMVEPEPADPIISALGNIVEIVNGLKKKVDKAIKESNLPDEIKDSLNIFTEYGFIAIVLFLIVGSAFGWIILSPIAPFIVLDITNLGILGTALMSVLLWGQLKKKANLIIAGKENKNRELELENQALKNALEKSCEPKELL